MVHITLSKVIKIELYTRQKKKRNTSSSSYKMYDVMQRFPIPLHYKSQVYEWLILPNTIRIRLHNQAQRHDKDTWFKTQCPTIAFMNSVHFLKIIKAVKHNQIDLSGIALCFVDDNLPFSLKTNSCFCFKWRHQTENLN